MQKKVLTEQALYFGKVEMPKNFEIDNNRLRADILEAYIQNGDFRFSRDWDKLNTYIRDHIKVKHDIKLVNKVSWGNVYKPSENTGPLLEVDPVDLRHSPDFIMLYGVQVKNCFVRIFYDDNRRKGRSWDIELKDNEFIIFPSNNTYTVSNKQKDDSLNFIQNITYEYL